MLVLPSRRTPGTTFSSEKSLLTARSIVTQCGIYTAGGIIMEGPVSCALDPNERIEVVLHLQVLARSSPEDKKILVETLCSLGEIAGITGSGTNDCPTLGTANIGFSAGIAGAERRLILSSWTTTPLQSSRLHVGLLCQRRRSSIPTVLDLDQRHCHHHNYISSCCRFY